MLFQSNMTTIGKRVEISREPDGITARIKMRKNGFVLIFHPIWLIGWTFGLISSLTSMADDGEEKGFLIFWLVGWIVVGGFAITVWAWNAFGREVISISRTSFTYRREILGRTLTKKTVPLVELSNLRAAGVFGAAFNRGLSQVGLGGGTIAIDQNWDTHRFGIELEEKEALALVEALKPYLSKSV